MAKHSTRPRGAEVRSLPEVASLRADQRERRERIIDAAMRLLADVDYDRIQVKDVADHAEVALGTLYRYFNSKDHLFACALLSWSSQFGDHLVLPVSGPTVDRVKVVYHRAVRAFEKQPRVYGALSEIRASRDALAVEVFHEFTSRQSDSFGIALEGSRLPDSKREDVTAVMGAVLDANLQSWYRDVRTLEQVHESIDRAADLIFGR